MVKRNTIQCNLVLKAVQTLNCHASADEVYEALSKEHPSISRATVYRNLQKLCESGQIRKCEIPNGADRFDHTVSDHYHLRCERCGGVFDVDMDYMTDLSKAIRDDHGFVITGHDVVFKGVCPDCARQEEDTKTVDTGDTTSREHKLQ